jgi:hypothetical protein
MTPLTKSILREATRLLLLWLGCYYLTAGGISALALLFVRTQPGVVPPPSLSGQQTNWFVVWGGGVVFLPQPGDWNSVPKVGDHVAVLPWPAPGTLKTGHALWRVWKQAACFAAVGAVLLVGYYALKRQSTPPGIHTYALSAVLVLAGGLMNFLGVLVTGGALIAFGVVIALGTAISLGHLKKW